MKRQRMATGFLHTSAILARSTLFDYIAIHAIEWRIRQCLERVDMMN